MSYLPQVFLHHTFFAHKLLLLPSLEGSLEAISPSNSRVDSLQQEPVWVDDTKSRETLYLLPTRMMPPNRRLKDTAFIVLLVFAFYNYHKEIVVDDIAPINIKVDNHPSARTNNTMEHVDIDIGHCYNSSVQVPSDLMIPIFVMTRDRISSLKTSLDSYQNTFTSCYEIIILDHQSSYPPMVQYLDELQTNHNVTVYQLKGGRWAQALNEAKGIIQNHLDQHHPNVEYFVFTDPDIAFLRAQHDLLLFYVGILRACPNIKTIGPALQISDIPANYFSRPKVYEHEKQWWVGGKEEWKYWDGVPRMATWNGM